MLEYDDNGNKISWLRSRNRFESDLEKGDVRLIQKEDGGWSVQFKQRLPKGKKNQDQFSLMKLYLINQVQLAMEVVIC